MNYKDIQKRLEGYQSTDLVQKQGMMTKGGKVYSADKMKRLWDLCHQDRETSYRQLMKQSGFNGGSDYTAIKKWFASRGWGELPPRIDPKEKYSEQIYGYYKDGLSAKQISRLVPMSQSSVLRVLKETYGVVFVTSQNNQPNQSDIDEFNRLTEQGISLRKIAKMTGWTHITVAKYRSQGVTPKEQQVNKQDLYREQVVRLYEQGNTQMNIVRATGISRGTVNRIIQKYKKTK
mgnify:CR=1 FL=1